MSKGRGGARYETPQKKTNEMKLQMLITDTKDLSVGDVTAAI